MRRDQLNTEHRTKELGELNRLQGDMTNQHMIDITNECRRQGGLVVDARVREQQPRQDCPSDEWLLTVHQVLRQGEGSRGRET